MSILSFTIPPTFDLNYLLRPSESLNASDAPDPSCWTSSDFESSITEFNHMVTGSIDGILNILTNDSFCHVFNLVRAFYSAEPNQQDMIASLFSQTCHLLSQLTLEVTKWVKGGCKDISAYHHLESLRDKLACSGEATVVEIGNAIKSIVEVVTMMVYSIIIGAKANLETTKTVGKKPKGKQKSTSNSALIGNSIAKSLIDITNGDLMAGYYVELGGTGRLSENFIKLILSGLLECISMGIILKGQVSLSIRAVLYKCLQFEAEKDEEEFIDWPSIVLETLKKSEGANLVSMFTTSEEDPLLEKAGKIVGELLIETRENAVLQSAALTTASVQTEFGNIGNFIEKLSNSCPIGLLLNRRPLFDLFDIPSYNLRKSVIDTITTLLQLKADDDVNEFKTLIMTSKDDLFSSLVGRAFDSYMYCRAHVLRGLQEVIENGSLSLRHYPKIAEIALGRLMDRGSMVRQKALGLIAALLADLTQNKFEPSNSSELLSTEKFSLEDEPLPELDMETDEGLLTSLKIHTLHLAYTALLTSKTYLKSTLESDQKAAIRFVGTLHVMGFKMASGYMHKIWELIWSNNQNVQDVVANEFSRLYFSNSPNDAARSLLSLVAISNNSCAASLDLLFKSCLARNDLPVVNMISDVLKALIAIATSQQPSDENERRRIDPSTPRYALGLCKIIIASSPNCEYILDSQQASLFTRIMTNLMRRSNPDFLTFSELCNFLRHCKGDGLSSISYLSINLIIEKFGIPDQYFFISSQAAIDLVFTHYPRPEDLCSLVVKGLIEKVVNSESVSSIVVSHILFITSHIALATTVALEGLACKLKQIRSKADQKAESMGVATRGELEIEEIENLVENGLTFKNFLGSHFKKLISFIANGKYKEDETLAKTLIISLSKLSVISKRFSTEDIGMDGNPLVNSLINILMCSIDNNSLNTAIRKTILITYGDLLCRFPNLIEPFNKRTILLLADRDNAVRETATLVFTHLVMNDMIKPKGTLAEHMAFLTLDVVTPIALCSKTFFIEINKKNPNNIYNLFPELVAVLVMNKRNMPLSVNATIAKMLLDFISKDRQQIVLVGKICERLTQSKNVNARDILTFILFQLCKEHKCIAKLASMASSLRHVLATSDAVRAPIWAIAMRGKSLRGPAAQATGSNDEEEPSQNETQKDSFKDLISVLSTFDPEPLSYQEPQLVERLSPEDYDKLFVSAHDMAKFEQLKLERVYDAVKVENLQTHQIRIKRELEYM